MSLFEVYDPYTFYLNSSLNWILVFIVFLLTSVGYWVVGGSWCFLINSVCSKLAGEFSNFYSMMKMKISLVLFIGLFLFILLVNILGLVPYVFASSAHFTFSISLGFPFWLSLMFLGWLNFCDSMFCHLIPVGTPLILISFMALIETVSNFIRPWSLSVRLMANMISGHLLMSLLGGCGWSVFLIQLALFSFEFFVCFIQAYVFCSLLALYSSEV